jgi:hypothetical protein
VRALVQAFRFYIYAVGQLPAIFGRVVLGFITILTSIGSTIGYFGIKWGDSLVSWWEGLSPWWGAILPVLSVAIILFLVAVHRQFQEIERKRDELELENQELIAESENRPEPLPDTLAEWVDKTPLFTIRNRTYRNDRIELDGRHYDRCVFDSCTFSFKGTKPFTVAESCRVEGDYNIDATAPQALAILVFLKSLGAFHSDFEYRDPVDGGLVD